METVSSKDCSSVDESPISVTASAQVGAPQKKGPMCEPIFVDSSMCIRLSMCSLYSSVDGMWPCPTLWFSVTGWLWRAPRQTLICVLRIRSTSSGHVEFPLMLKKSFRRTESCQTQSNDFDTLWNWQTPYPQYRGSLIPCCVFRKLAQCLIPQSPGTCYLWLYLDWGLAGSWSDCIGAYLKHGIRLLWPYHDQ